jgi:para-nitrobenzyl esterase
MDVRRTLIVQTESGPVAGLDVGGMARFLGIPYATAPVGDLRWLPPQMPVAWAAVLEAFEYGNWCAQKELGVYSEPSTTEDCLYLNVFRRAGAAANDKLPVMVWIPGGGLIGGRSNDYDPAKLVLESNVIFVSFNYRIGAFGFFSHPALDEEGHDFANYGFMDQQFALKWVQQNIGRFGGDPDNVTIFGESAGGMSALFHMASPRSKGLFHKAIVQSGSFPLSPYQEGFNGAPVETARNYARAVVQRLGLAEDVDGAGLRSVPAEAFVEATSTFGYAATGVVAIDGSILPMSIEDAFKTGNFNRVPVINGGTRDEWTWMVGMLEAASGHAMTADEFPDALRAIFGAHAGKVGRQYPPEKYGNSPGLALANAQTDSFYVYSLLRTNQLLARYVPVWAYRFDDDQGPNPFPEVSFPYGAAHALELPYLFEHYLCPEGTSQVLGKDQAKLSREMVAYWTNFARSGNPNSTGTGSWPRYNESRQYLALVPPQSQLIDEAAIAVARGITTFWQPLFEADKTGASDEASKS